MSFLVDLPTFLPDMVCFDDAKFYNYHKFETKTQRLNVRYLVRTLQLLNDN